MLKRNLLRYLLQVSPVSFNKTGQAGQSRRQIQLLPPALASRCTRPVVQSASGGAGEDVSECEDSDEESTSCALSQ